MNLRISADFEKMAQIHQRIFIHPFPMDKIHKRLARGQKLLSVIFLNEEDAVIGFSIAVEEKDSLHLWLGGLAPEFQGQGLMEEYLVWLENYAHANGFQRLTMNVDNSRFHSLRFALKHGFRIIAVEEGGYGDGKKIGLEKRLARPLNLRLALTRQCNFKCIFCHGEGLPPCPGARLSPPQLENILVQAARLNIASLTFTGGEPLLEKEALLYGLKLHADLCEKIPVKLVTNGALLDEEMAARLAAFANLRINLSLHAPKAAGCAAITGVDDAFDRACKAMELCREYGLAWRVNCVPLRGVLDSAASVEKLLRLLLDKGAPEISFLELGARKDSSLAKYHLPLPELKNLISSVSAKFGAIHFVSDKGYKSTYRLQTGASSLLINLFKLSCGDCQNCLPRKDETIGPDAQLYPCFFSSQTAGDAVEDLFGALQGSRAFVRGRVEANFNPNLVRA